MGTLTASKLDYPVTKRVLGNFAFGSSYNNTGNDNTTGETISAKTLGLSRIKRIKLQPEAGYEFQVLYSVSGAEGEEPTGVRVKVFQGGSGTSGNATAVNNSSAVSGTGTFLGTSPVSDLNLATPAFSGTGLTAAAQVITTTDNQTMTLNQCAGMWLISATGATPPNLILSNTAVNAAPAVLTVQGAASTDAGAYKIVKALTPVGSVTALAGTAVAQVQNAHNHAIGAAAGGEVPNATDLSTSLAKVQFEAEGY